MVNTLVSALFDGVFPHRCALCGLRSERPLPLCLECERELPVNRACCARCAIPLPHADEALNTQTCGRCQQSPPPFDRVLAPWLYGEYLAHLIHQWKYRRDRRLTALLAALWVRRAPPPTPVDIVVPVPLHWLRSWRRGFNQSDLLARELLATCPALVGCALAPGLLRRNRATASQSGMSARQRAGNLAGAFTVRERCDNLRVAIVDDVLTTGATADAVAGALVEAGAAYIEVWCLARTPAPGS